MFKSKLAEGEVCRYRIEARESIFIPERVLSDGMIRFGFKIDNAVSSKPLTSVHNWTPIKCRTTVKKEELTVEVPYIDYDITIDQTLVWCYYGRMKPYAKKQSGFTMHLPQEALDLIESKPSASTTVKSGMEKKWQEMRETARTRTELGGAWIGKFGKPNVIFDIKLSKAENALYIESSLRIKVEGFLSPKEKLALYAYLKFANEVACKYLHNFSMAKMKQIIANED